MNIHQSLHNMRIDIENMTSFKLEKSCFSINFSLTEFSKTCNFVVRQKKLAEIDKILNSNSGCQTVVLHSLDRIGKTQLTIAYANAYQTKYTAMFWLNIKDNNSVKHSYARIAKRILNKHSLTTELSAIAEDSKLDEVVKADKQWFNQLKNNAWLIMFNNYDKLKLSGQNDEETVNIKWFLSDTYHGSVIVTMRSFWVHIEHQLQVNKLEDVHDSLQILCNVSLQQIELNCELVLLFTHTRLTSS